MKTKKDQTVEFAAVVRIKNLPNNRVEAMVVPIYWERDGERRLGSGLAFGDKDWPAVELAEVEKATTEKFGQAPKITSPAFAGWLKFCQAQID